MKALIFGANGQDGYYLSKICQERGIEPIGISRSGNWQHGDVSNYEQVAQFIQYYTPNYIFHLAANSKTNHKALFENHQTIATGTLNILESTYKYSPKTNVFIAGSGLQFENKNQPISEQTPFAATSPYAIARIQSVYAARYYRSLGLSVYVGYLFHHESPLRKPNHVSQKIVLAVKRIAAGSNEIIELGDITVEKEWAFAGDIIRGIFTLVEQNNIFESVIGSGVTYSIEGWLNQCFSFIGKDWHEYVKLRPGFVSEYKRLISSPHLINSLGWFPSVSFSELAVMMMNKNIEEKQ
ncbi:GDP-mannose 4,6-dehydratase [Gloeothece verrucosa]|uniref:GDP-mannose 4,6-dehydratase n=1 Tax=Gloeothece verrucosa (strain PCC 7822) TaxID=497965 RepID=E0U826_GLOV7|nr:GDP-mannose 4,6-dehydratase [Gloeothece verrucosa]ADN17231.1 GDP-mannose 4,6-dehydratase [Gloeothece verrucosa PCC 7822]